MLQMATDTPLPTRAYTASRVPVLCLDIRSLDDPAPSAIVDRGPSNHGPTMFSDNGLDASL
jgi:hypothetical protein